VSERDPFDLELVMPDGTELSYGPVPFGAVPAVGEVVWFQRTDPMNQLLPDENGLEGPHWVVLGREWSFRRVGVKAPYTVAFLILRLGESIGSPEVE
jgi:hypothetical protein